MSDPPLLEVENLRVRLRRRTAVTPRGAHVSFALGRERLGIVGESRLRQVDDRRAPSWACPRRRTRRCAPTVSSSTAWICRALDERDMRRVRGKRIAMVMQDPKYSLNPVMTRRRADRGGLSRATSQLRRRAARAAALEMIASGADPRSRAVYCRYPHQVSGGMGQRVMIAMMLVAEPGAADRGRADLGARCRRRQRQVLALHRRRWSPDAAWGIIFVSHDLELVASFCDRVLVMYAGRVVDACRADRAHPTRLLASIRDDGKRLPYTRIPLLDARFGLDP